ncbi:MAG: putative helicase carboxy-terminal domain protein, partial [Streblomastix strix]
MGLGKTLQALAISCAYPEDWPLIVICPSTLRFHWADEIERWCGREMCPPGSVKAVLSSKDILTGKERAVVITYELCVRMINDVTRMKFNIAISDESHYLKNWKSKRAKMIFPVIRSCNRLLLLTGTPAINRPIELFTQLHTLRPDIFSTVSEFSNRYCGAQKKAAWTDMSGATNLTELHLLIGETVMIRRLKREVLKQLPPKRRMA